MLREVIKQVQGYRTKDGAGVSLVRVLGNETTDDYDLHESGVPEDSEHLQRTWEIICNDENHHIIVCEVDGKLVSSCVCVIVPNLTRHIRPYVFIENVVTHADHRGMGYATACLNYAKDLAVKSDCYKMMLLTGAKSDRTLDFYKKAGYNCTDKTAFIQWL